MQTWDTGKTELVNKWRKGNVKRGVIPDIDDIGIVRDSATEDPGEVVCAGQLLEDMFFCVGKIEGFEVVVCWWGRDEKSR